METDLKLTQEERGISDGVLGMVFLLATEAMFFTGLISSYIVNRATFTIWPPLNQPRLPVAMTAINTFVLLSSAFVYYLYSKKVKNNASKKESNPLLVLSILLGLTFLLVQGFEWIRLIIPFRLISS